MDSFLLSKLKTRKTPKLSKGEKEYIKEPEKESPYKMNRINSSEEKIDAAIKLIYDEVVTKLTEKEKDFEYFKKNYQKILNKHGFKR